MPGDGLIVDMWLTRQKEDGDGREEVIFVARVDGGKVVLSNGRALLSKVEKPAGSKL